MLPGLEDMLQSSITRGQRQVAEFLQRLGKAACLAGTGTCQLGAVRGPQRGSASTIMQPCGSSSAV